jgi:crotonobetainyl-CoA:carnitine CoA-transferase CaiB-like acyl-CoA transferase
MPGGRDHPGLLTLVRRHIAVPSTTVLGSERGRELLKQLAAKCDIIVENFRPSTPEKWGLGYEELPRLSETPGEIRWLGAGLGAQNEDIYKVLLELSSAEIEDLRISGVI